MSRVLFSIIPLSVMVFELKLIAVKLVQEEALADLQQSYHAALDVARPSVNGSMGNIKRVKCWVVQCFSDDSLSTKQKLLRIV